MQPARPEKTRRPPISVAVRTQEPFSRVAPVLKTALLMGAGGGFVLAAILTLSLLLSIPPGTWWAAVAQAHGHLQLYGWAGLFVLGVALHFLPRLFGSPLAGAHLVPWFVGIMSASLILRAVSQAALALTRGNLWYVGLLSSGIGELVAVGLVLFILLGTALWGPHPATRPAYWSVFPFLVGASASLILACVINLVNLTQAIGGSGLVPDTGDTLNVTLGLFGFLVPMALAMSARSLPMYAGLDGFPHRILWPMAGVYFAGLVLLCLGSGGNLISSSWASVPGGLGMILLGGAVLLFIGIFLRLVRRRGRLPKRVAELSPSPQKLAHTYQQQVAREHTAYGPFVGLVASAYLWALLGALCLVIDGVSTLATGQKLLVFDAIRHSFALGFLALLICVIAPRMLPSFSGRTIVSPKLVSATLWLGNTAAVLRVGTLLVAPFLGSTVYLWLFGLSGPCGWLLALCLAINLWPTLRSSTGDHQRGHLPATTVTPGPGNV
ncbi:MAG TPA: hypothetical protein VFN35_33855 [Ktedonobacteraceae bacterium]|nr:hypothetical protein [Ktedonobacteraceae bacterium]